MNVISQSEENIEIEIKQWKFEKALKEILKMLSLIFDRERLSNRGLNRYSTRAAAQGGNALLISVMIFTLYPWRP